MRFPWTRRRSAGPKPSRVPADWLQTAEWPGWEAPRNYVAPEDAHAGAIAALTGPPGDSGACVAAEITLLREPDHAEDPNAFRAEVGGEPVGYLRAHIAAQLAAPFDRAKIAAFAVCGIVRAGPSAEPDPGVHIWLDRTLTPGLELSLPDEDEAMTTAPWPPAEGELREPPPPAPAEASGDGADPAEDD